ncbi:CGNR zinc finger domain-containing protein [Nocardia brasiliensis]|uniref:CGNR zinc finger domain-containing protein n=1 Tax=Nocardia brasiliensis TaxID=37326 RepID=UPI0024543C45|nr:CGNR zinc finger domain-containing protein [Nocardia brasiliensis]
MPSPVPPADHAPPALHRIVEFVNTRRADGDHLTTPAQLLTWLNNYDLLADPTNTFGAPATLNAADAASGSAMHEEPRADTIARSGARGVPQSGGTAGSRDGLVDAGGLQRALYLREGLRALLAENNAAPVQSPRPDGLDPQAFQKCRTLTDMLPLVLDITGPQPRLVPHTDDPVDFALATMLADVFAAVSAGTWPRMKACREPSCRWAFYDHSRNRGRTWCSMNVCGNRVKVRASHRRRTIS